MKYNVHLYPVVRVKVCDIEAESQVEAINEAEKTCDLHALLDHSETEWAEEVAYYLVDEEGDEEYYRSRFYDSDGKTELNVSDERKKQLREFTELIARMKTTEELEENYPEYESLNALDELIVSAREITGIYPEEPVTDEERSNGPGKK